MVGVRHDVARPDGGLTTAFSADPVAVSGLAGRRRMIGGFTLLLALIAALAAPRLLAPGVVGEGSAAPLPPPPAIGSCLAIGADGPGVVPCDQPHWAEVYQTWPPDLFTDRWASSGDGAVPRAVDTDHSGGTPPAGGSLCMSLIGDYLGAAPTSKDALWARASMLVVAQYITAPADQGVGGHRWSACVVTAPDGEAYVGTMHNGGVPGNPAPAKFQSCVVSGSGTGVGIVSCDHAHRIEILGWLQVSDQMVADGTLVLPPPAQIQQSCVDLARSVTGADDPTYGGQLRISARPLTWVATDPPLPGSSAVAVPDCFGELVGEGELVGTVMGLGDAPLPVG